MPRFQVEVREYHRSTYYVDDVATAEEARAKVASSTVGPLETEFVEPMDTPEEYFVMEIDAEGNAVEPNPDALTILSEG